MVPGLLKTHFFGSFLSEGKVPKGPEGSFWALTPGASLKAVSQGLKKLVLEFADTHAHC